LTTPTLSILNKITITRESARAIIDARSRTNERNPADGGHRQNEGNREQGDQQASAEHDTPPLTE
jgi:hypothetical protein